MRFALMTEPQQGLTYAEILAVAQTAEEVGSRASSDPTTTRASPARPAGRRPTRGRRLAGLARETSRITLGVLVSPVTFRPPGNFAKVVTTVAEMSGGRVEVGLGAGWNEARARAARPVLSRDDRALRHARRAARDRPRPVDRAGRVELPGNALVSVGRAVRIRSPSARAGRRHPNIIVGGRGGRAGCARLVARYADEMNVSSASPAVVAEAYARVGRRLPLAIGRDPGEVTRSAMTGVLVGETRPTCATGLKSCWQPSGSAGSNADGLARRPPPALDHRARRTRRAHVLPTSRPRAWSG